MAGFAGPEWKKWSPVKSLGDPSEAAADATTPDGAAGEGVPRLLAGFDAEVTRLIVARASRIAAPAGACLFRPGDACRSLVLLEKGRVRVGMLSEHGRRIELYSVEPGEACVMSVACLLGELPYQAEAIAETDVSGWALGQGAFRELIALSPAFAERLLAVQWRRIYDLVGLVDRVAFHRTEARLAALLMARAGADAVVRETHQDLALAIGTAREVVSRRLKRLEADGVVALERAQVRILDRPRLAALVSE